MDGVKRRTQDLSALAHNHWQRWLELNAESLQVAQKISDNRIRLLERKDFSQAEMDFDYDAVLAEVSSSCDEATRLVAEYEKLAIKVKQMLPDIAALGILNDKTGSDVDTATVEALQRLVEDMVSTFSNELLCKKAVFEQLPIATTRDLLTFCMACLVHQPYVDEFRLTRMLNVVLVSIGHKKD